MNNFLQKNHSALIKGGIISLILASILYKAGVVLINPIHVSISIYIVINILGFIFCWFIFSFLVQKFSIYTILSVISLLLIATVADNYIKTPFNLISIPSIILFWLGITYLILPQFFIKYKFPILLIYGAVLSYFFIFRIRPYYIENHHQNFLNFMLIPIPFFMLLWGYEQWRWLKTLQIDKGKAELALLKSQVNPHFFFNTLNNLYGLVVEKSDDAPEVILKLSDMMRYTIYKGKEDTVLLKDEINYLENYIELHKIRYQKKVEILFAHKVQEGLKIAPLLFIILLENAFKHGVEKMREHAFICLEMQSEGKKLSFTIENNFNELTSNHKKGIGLDNLRKRLNYLYNNKYELVIEKRETNYKVLLTLNLI